MRMRLLLLALCHFKSSVLSRMLSAHGHCSEMLLVGTDSDRKEHALRIKLTYLYL